MVFDVSILCAGRGTRLSSLTDNKPKAMITILDKPLIHWIWDSIQHLDYYNLYIVTGYRYNVIEPYVKTYLDSYVKFIKQFERTGTANAIYLLKNHVGDDFLVLAGDSIFKKEELSRLAENKNSLLYTKRDEYLYECGTLELEGDEIKHINEKSTEPTSNLVNCSAYHFTKNVFDYIPKTPVDKRFEEKIITNTINLMIDDGIKFKGIKIDELNEITRPKDVPIMEERLKKWS